MEEPNLRKVRFGDVVELRQYTLHPGRRDELIDVFEEYFIESQVGCGIDVGGLFRDQGDADRFVWMRGFENLDDRTRALAGFYGGPVWAQHREQANATMIDSDDVLLLKPCLLPCDRGRDASTPNSTTRAVAGAWTGAPADEADWVSASEIHELLAAELQACLGLYESHPGPNGFPALPVRNERALVWLAAFSDQHHQDRAMERLNSSPVWRGLHDAVRQSGVAYQQLTLLPTVRSRHSWMLDAFHSAERSA